MKATSAFRRSSVQGKLAARRGRKARDLAATSVEAARLPAPMAFPTYEVNEREVQADATHLGRGDPGVDGPLTGSRDAVGLTMRTPVCIGATPVPTATVPSPLDLVLRAGHRWY